MTLFILKGVRSQWVGGAGYAGNRRMGSASNSFSLKGRRTLIGPADQLIRQIGGQIAVSQSSVGDLPAAEGGAGVGADDAVDALGIKSEPGQGGLGPDALIAGQGGVVGPGRDETGTAGDSTICLGG